MSQALLTVPQACEQLACSLATLKRRIRTGQLPVFRDGRIIRIRQQDLDHYIDQRVQLPAQPKTAAHTLPPAPVEVDRKLFDLTDPLT